jgi:UDP-N-acetylglucosamine 2-epimerase
VYGDTNSTLAGALTAAKMQIPLAHVEAGLRSYNRAMPEEINRIVADSLSALLFCPTDTAIKNLEKEGIVKGVHQVGDVMYDALLQNLEIARKHSQILNTHGLQKGEYSLATVHRAANTDNQERMAAILSAFSKMATRIIFPVHPRTKKMMQEWGLRPAANIVLIEPVGRFDMLVLQENANCILTDSGGVQKEAYFVGVRCITLREETEWVETVQAGWNKLTGVIEADILSAFENWHPQGNRPELYGDGDSSGKISVILKSYLL